ncbi:MAG: hypothetical protein CMA29_03625 [Euryarchaeota archaeon]|nr:hypothetical protein [Euryarchaeota archaeon]
MAGCLSSSPINWGSDIGQYSAVMNENNTEIVIDDRMSVYQESYLESVGIGAVGCQGENGTMAQSSQSVVADEYGGTPIRIEGWLANGKAFPDHDGPAVYSIAVNMMPIEEANNLKPHELDPQEDIPLMKEWDDPLMAEGQFGSEFEDIQSKRGWAVIGVIPASENIADGMIGLLDWNRPISIEGYFLHDQKNIRIPTELSVSDCSVSSRESFGAYFAVTSMTIAGNDASASEEYSVGSIPLVGGSLYLLLVIIGGAAGAFGAFTFSTIQIRKKANQTASVLMSEKQIRSAGGVDRDLKQHRRDVEKLEKSSSSSNIEVVDDTATKKMEIKEFDVSGTLESAPDGLEATASLGKTTGRGVIQTEEAAEMDEKLKAVMENAMTKEETVSAGPSSRRIGGGVTSSGSSSVSPSAKRNMANISTTKTDVNEDIIEQKSPPVSRRKRVVKKEVVPEIEEDEVPEDTGPRYETREGPSLSDDEEFSDFSF